MQKKGRTDLAGIALQDFNNRSELEGPEGDFRTRFYSMLVLNQDPDITAFIVELGTIEQRIFKVFTGPEKQRNYLKFDFDGCLTSFLKFWNAWIDRENNATLSTVLGQRIALIIPLLHAKERSYDLSKDHILYGPKVTEFCKRETKFCNFEEKHGLLNDVLDKFS